jgi:hypothetical protein
MAKRHITQGTRKGFLAGVCVHARLVSFRISFPPKINIFITQNLNFFACTNIDDSLVLYMANNEFKRRFTSGILKDRFKSDKEAKRRQIARVTAELYCIADME